MLTKSRTTGLTVLLLGLVFLFRSLGLPRVQVLHGADIVGLLGCGACLGVAFIGLIDRLKLPEK